MGLPRCVSTIALTVPLFPPCLPIDSVILGRRRFGSQGWSRSYGFNLGDLTICANVLQNYLNHATGTAPVPWQDLRYIFGEIMYGGHITDYWDRRTNNTYLEVRLCCVRFQIPLKKS